MHILVLFQILEGKHVLAVKISFVHEPLPIFSRATLEGNAVLAYSSLRSQRPTILILIKMASVLKF